MKKRKDHIYNTPRKIPALNAVFETVIASSPEFSRLKTIMRILRAWDETVGEKLRRVTRVIKYENSVLFIRVTSSVWRNEFFHIEDEIKNRLRGKLGDIKITKIVFL